MCDNVIFGRLCDLWMESPDVSGACTRGVERGETTVISTVGILWCLERNGDADLSSQGAALTPDNICVMPIVMRRRSWWSVRGAARATREGLALPRLCARAHFRARGVWRGALRRSAPTWWGHATESQLRKAYIARAAGARSVREFGRRAP